LARSIGLPARLVAGYLINSAAEYQIVKSTQKHAYAEVLFEDLGWITFDATAPCNCLMKTEPPKLEIIYPSEGAYISGSKITIAGEAYGFYKNAELYINHTGFSLTFWNGEFAFDNTTYIQDGELSIEVSISDAAGNRASDSVKFTVDNTPPKVSITFPSNGTSMSTPTIYINGTINELNKGNLKPYINDTPLHTSLLERFNRNLFIHKPNQHFRRNQRRSYLRGSRWKQGLRRCKLHRFTSTTSNPHLHTYKHNKL